MQRHSRSAVGDDLAGQAADEELQQVIQAGKV